MRSLITTVKAQKMLSANLRQHRLNIGLTQAGLAKRSGVPLATLRKYEQKGVISISSFLKLSMVLGLLDNLVQATEPCERTFVTIDDVLNEKFDKKRQRGNQS